MSAPGGDSWAGRPRVALLVRLGYAVIPLVAACVASAGLVRFSAQAAAPTVLRWVAVLATSTVVLVLTHRMLARLLPLAALLELSIEFPGPAPSRYVVARDAGNPAKLAEIVVRAQRGDRMVNLKDAEAARDILALVAALRSHDTQTRGHSERVRVFTDLIAQQLRLPRQDRAQLRWAALLHDVGKLQVPADVLNKTEKLNQSDWQALRAHPTAGARITWPLNNWLGGWSDTIGQHHEKYDGSGYPRGLSGEEISLGARIVAVADAFDVMTAARSYRKPIGRAAALRELHACSGTHFDPRVVRAMLAVSTPKLKVAMGPLSWLGAAPFLAASQGAATAAAQATVGALVAGTVIVAGPTASATPSGVPGTPVTTGHHKATAIATHPSRGASPSGSPKTGSPKTKPSAPGKASAHPRRPKTSPTPTANPKPTQKPVPRPATSKTPKPAPAPSPSPADKRKGKPTAHPRHSNA